MASESSGTIAPALPAGTAAGDVAVLVVAGRPTDASQPTAPTGWTLRTSVFQNVSSSDLRIMTFYRVLAGGDANPAITLPAGWVGSTGGMSGQIAVWRGVDTAVPFDVADATGTSNPDDVFTAPAITTATANAFVVSAVATSDNNDLVLNTAAGLYGPHVGSQLRHAARRRSCRRVGRHAAGRGRLAACRNGRRTTATPTVGPRSRLRCAATCRRRRAISYNFEETSWTGAVGEVNDEQQLGLDGRAFGGATTANATPVVATDPGTCRYGVFDGVDEYVEVPDNAALDITAELTVAAWIYMRSAPSELHTIASKDTNYEYHIDSQRRVFWWWQDSSNTTRSLTTTTQLTLNQWYHVAITYASGAQRIYINGVLQGTTGSWTGTLATNNLPFYVGTDWNYLSRAFDGYIDEVRVINDALTQPEIVALRDETHPCANTARFTITHNAFGIHCLAETVTVNVIDATTGTPLLNYNAPVQLDTQSGFGGWALTAGSGAFSDGTAGDGVATYTWPLGQSQATFALSYPQGPPAIDVDVFQITQQRHPRQRRGGPARVLAERVHGHGRGAVEPARRGRSVRDAVRRPARTSRCTWLPTVRRPSDRRVRNHRVVHGDEEREVLVAVPESVERNAQCDD